LALAMILVGLLVSLV